MLPGKKDYVSLGHGQREQKRLILCNLRELYENYKSDYPQDKIGFSTFSSLRPKYSILAGASGTHSVCVCLLHQNPKLLLHACKCKIKLNDLIPLLVCDINEPKCMKRLCTTCTNKEKFTKTIVEQVFSAPLMQL